VGFHSLTTTTHPSNVNLPSSEQQVTARLSVRKVSVTEGNRAQDPLIRDTTENMGSIVIKENRFLTYPMGLEPSGCLCLLRNGYPGTCPRRKVTGVYADRTHPV